MTARLLRTADRLRRLLAAGSAALVFALTVFAASPQAHQWLHAADAGAADDDCAVVLFASGVAPPVGPVHVTPPVEVVADASIAPATEVLLVAPRYLRQPERGPPAVWAS